MQVCRPADQLSSRSYVHTAFCMKPNVVRRKMGAEGQGRVGSKLSPCRRVHGALPRRGVMFGRVKEKATDLNGRCILLPSFENIRVSASQMPAGKMTRGHESQKKKLATQMIGFTPSPILGTPPPIITILLFILF